LSSAGHGGENQARKRHRKYHPKHVSLPPLSFSKLSHPKPAVIDANQYTARRFDKADRSPPSRKTHTASEIVTKLSLVDELMTHGRSVSETGKSSV